MSGLARVVVDAEDEWIAKGFALLLIALSWLDGVIHPGDWTVAGLLFLFAGYGGLRAFIRASGRVRSSGPEIAAVICLLVFLGLNTAAAFRPLFAVMEESRGHVFESVEGPLRLWASADTGLAQERLGYWVCGLLVFLTVRLGLRRASTCRLLLAISVANFTVLAMVGMVMKLTGSDGILWRFGALNPSFFATFHYHNFWVANAILAIGGGLLLLSRSLRVNESGRFSRAQALLVTVLFFLVLSLFFTGSRTGAIVSCLLAASVAAGGLFRFIRRRRRVGWHPGRGEAVLLAILLGGMAVGVFLGFPYLKERWESTVYRMERGDLLMGERMRPYLWKTGLAAVGKRPVSGWGAGSVPVVYDAAAGYVAYLDGVGSPPLVHHCHNDWLEVVLESGFVGVFFLGSGVVLFFVSGLRGSLRRSGGGWLWLAAGLVAFHAFWDFPLQNRVVWVHFCALVGCAMVYNRLRGEARWAWPEDDS